MLESLLLVSQASDLTKKRTKIQLLGRFYLCCHRHERMLGGDHASGPGFDSQASRYLCKPRPFDMINARKSLGREYIIRFHTTIYRSIRNYESLK